MNNMTFRTSTKLY